MIGLEVVNLFNGSVVWDLSYQVLPLSLTWDSYSAHSIEHTSSLLLPPFVLKDVGVWKTQGSGHVYGTMLQPYLMKNEAEIERMMVEMKVRAWDLSYLFWTNFSEMAHSGFLKVLKCAADFQSTRFKNSPFQLQVFHFYINFYNFYWCLKLIFRN